MYLDQEGVYQSILLRQIDLKKEDRPYVSDDERSKLIEQFTRENKQRCEPYNAEIKKYQKISAGNFVKPTCLKAKQKLRKFKQGYSRRRDDLKQKKRDILEKAVVFYCHQTKGGAPKSFVPPGIIDKIN